MNALKVIKAMPQLDLGPTEIILRENKTKRDKDTC